MIVETATVVALILAIIVGSYVLVKLCFAIGKFVELCHVKRTSDISWSQAYSAMKEVWAKEDKEMKEWLAKNKAKERKNLKKKVDKILSKRLKENR